MKHRRKIWIAAGFCLAVAAFLLIAHHRAKAAAEKLKTQLRTQGEKLSIVELTPPPPANGPNGSDGFLHAASRLSAISDALMPAPMAFTEPGRARVAFSQAVLPTSDSTNAWPGLGAQLDALQTSFEELHASLASPVFRFPVNYQQGFATLLPHLAPIKRTTRALSVETLHRLHRHQSAEALSALLGTIKVPARFHDEPLFISQLVRHALIAIAAFTTWEALQYPDWNDRQLAAIQSSWESLTILSEAPSAFSMERVWTLDEFENCRESLARIDNLWGGGAGGNPLDDLAGIGTKAMESPKEGVDQFLDRFPRRWVWKWWTSYSDEVWFLSWSQLYLQSARNLESGVPYLTVKHQAEAELARRGETPRAFLFSREAAGEFPASFLKKAVTAETQRRLVITAIALKRHRQRHGKLPADLSALAPEFFSAVPLDPLDGKPLRYRTAADEEFLLYSIGTNGTDEGGDPRPESSTAKNFYWTSGRDWVWPLPASPEDVAKYHEDLEARRRKAKR